MRHIVMTDTIKAAIEAKMVQKMHEQLADVRLGAQKTVTISYTPEEYELTEPILLNFTGLAYAKQNTLVRECKSEIAWHGIVTANAERTVFNIEDIEVYPQTVTGTTVVTDESKYENWKAQLPDEKFNKLRFQAHSHVNMGITPSGTDRTLYDNILQCLGSESFYIFMIINKSNQMHVEIYDIKNNAIYDNNDVIVLVENEEIEDWYIDVYEKNVTAATPHYAPHTFPNTFPNTGHRNTHATARNTNLDDYREYFEDQFTDSGRARAQASLAADKSKKDKNANNRKR